MKYSQDYLFLNIKKPNNLNFSHIDISTKSKKEKTNQ